MTPNERLHSYLQHNTVRSTDPRWETILSDLRSGWIRLERRPGAAIAQIVVVGA